MRQIVSTLRTPPRLAEVPVPSLRSRGVLIKVAFSALSVGTERSAAKSAQQGLVAKARSKPDRALQVLDGILKNGVARTVQAVNNTLERWIPLGYSCAGIVTDVGSEVSEFRVGDRVACGGGGFASHGEFCYVPRRLVVPVPDSVRLDHASLATIGAIAMHGFRQAEVSLGEHVAVLGLGIVGQLACQIATAAGCRVIAMDLDPERVELAHRLGAWRGIVIERDSAKETVLRLTNDVGVDAVLLTAATPSDEPMRLSASLCRDRGRIVIVGDVGMKLDRQLLYDKELEIRLSRSYGPGRYDPTYEERGIDYPIGYVRWTEQRNLLAFVELLESERLQIEPLITHRFGFDKADYAYELITGAGAAAALGVLLEYADEKPASMVRSITLAAPNSAKPKGQIGIGFIGAGAFARSVLLPALKDHPVSLIGIATSSGMSASEIGGKYGFEYATTDSRKVLDDSRIDCVFIATRHDTHARLVVEALRAGKSVFVEKPLALTMEELEAVAVAQAESAGSVMVGFNRRFAPMIKQAVELFGPNHGPLVIGIRVNAGLIQRHWSSSAEEGGGRIVGEGCHFVDLAQYIAGSRPVSVYARALPASGSALEENVAVTMEFQNGSIASLTYLAVGHAKIEKEHIEIFGDGKTAIITDFKEIRAADGGRVIERRGRQDKGHTAELAACIASVTRRMPSPIPFDQAVDATLATFAVVQSCRTGRSYDPRTPFGDSN